MLKSQLGSFAIVLEREDKKKAKPTCKSVSGTITFPLLEA
jgi:hypothetical protein